MSSRLSAATRLRRQMATGLPSTRPRRHAGSQGRSHVRPRIPGNTLDFQLTMYASPYRPSAISRMYSGTGVCAGHAHWQSTTLWKYSGAPISVGSNTPILLFDNLPGLFSFYRWLDTPGGVLRVGRGLLEAMLDRLL